MAQTGKKISGHRLLKYAGNTATILAVFMIIQRLLSYDIDYSILLSKKNLYFFLLLLLLYIPLVVIGGLPWISIVNVLSDCRIRYSEAVYIFVKSNMFKYIPGNIFQYVGRNKLATEKNIKHSEVALATVLDICCYIVTGTLVSLLLTGSKLRLWIQEQNITFFSTKTFVLCILTAIAVIIPFSVCLWKKPFFRRIFLRIMNPKFMGVLLFNFIFYAILGLSTAGICVCIFSILSGHMFPAHEVATYTGIMQASHVIGFITPGAPAGVGVKEAVSLFLLHGMMDESIILSGILIMRVLSVIGDFAAYVFLLVFRGIRGRNKS
mgnify:CR=1 FL=1